MRRGRFRACRNKAFVQIRLQKDDLFPAGKALACRHRRAARLRQSRRCSLQCMRILLQQSNTDLYFKDIDSWTADSVEAMDFVSSTVALDFCAVNHLAGVQIVLKFDGEKYDIVLPPVAAPAQSSYRPSASV
jgi:hypothetical protein